VNTPIILLCEHGRPATPPCDKCIAAAVPAQVPAVITEVPKAAATPVLTVPIEVTTPVPVADVHPTADYLRRLFLADDRVLIFLLHSTETYIRLGDSCYTSRDTTTSKTEVYERVYSRKGADYRVRFTPFKDEKGKDRVKVEYSRAGENVWTVTKNRPKASTLELPRSLDRACAKDTLDLLAGKNADGWNVFITMNPIHPTSNRREEEDIAAFRSVYIEIDENGDAELLNIKTAVDAGEIPRPNAVLSSSPGKYHVVWYITGEWTAELQGATCEALQVRFHGDPASKDITRVLRLPDFRNVKVKYADKPLVTIRFLHDERALPSAFKLPVAVAEKKKMPQGEENLPKMNGRIKVMDDYYERHQIAADCAEVRDKFWKFRWTTDCPNQDSHTIDDGRHGVSIARDGTMGFKCFHGHGCENIHWAEYKTYLEELTEEKLVFGDDERDHSKDVLFSGVASKAANDPKGQAEEEKIDYTHNPNAEVCYCFRRGCAEKTAYFFGRAAGAAEAKTDDRQVEQNTDSIPPFNPRVMEGTIYEKFVHLVTDGTTLLPQFSYQMAKLILGAMLAGRIEFEGLAGDQPLRRLVMLGATGTGKGESYRRAEIVIKTGVSDSEPRIKLTDGADSGAGLRDFFLEPPRTAPVLVYIDEAATLGHRSADNKNPDILDALGELANRHVVSRTKAKRGQGKPSVTMDEAYLTTVICAPDGLTFMAATAGRKVAGFNDRQHPCFERPVRRGDKPKMPLGAILDWWAEVNKIEIMAGTRTQPNMVRVSGDAKAALDAYWETQPKDIQTRVRLEEYLRVDACMNAVARGRMEVSLRDAEDAIIESRRELATRAACFTEEVTDRVGFYFQRMKAMEERMAKAIAASPNSDPFLLGKSEKDFFEETDARRNNEPEPWARAWRVFVRFMMPVEGTARNGRKVTRYVPKAEER
jgi:hypothetical protein